MSLFSKVAWKEGLFLQPHHFQQQDRYLERLLRARTEALTPYPWGLVTLEFDRDLAKSRKIGLRRCAGILVDGTPFDAPDADRLPLPIDVAEDAGDLTIWLTLPDAAPGTQEVGMEAAGAQTRYVVDVQEAVDNTRGGHDKRGLEVAVPRLELSVSRTQKQGHQCLPIGRVASVRDQVVSIDETVPPVGLVLSVHKAYLGYLERVTGFVTDQIAALARTAADPKAGMMDGSDYLMLMILNRELPALRHLATGNVHPERLYEKLIALAGELSTFDHDRRAAPTYGPYAHDDPKGSFTPVVDDIQRLLSRDMSRAINLPLVERGTNAYVATVQDRNLFATAMFVIEVASALPPSQVQQQFPEYCKIGPRSRMKDIVNSGLRGIRLVHMPTPPRQLYVRHQNVYFMLEKSPDLWADFSRSAAIGLQLVGNWQDIDLQLWAIPER